MNNKGFTTIEVVLSFAMVVIILASMTGMVVNYRDRVSEEEIRTQMVDFKNTVTKVVYDDIVRGDYKRIEYCVDDPLCVNFVTSLNESFSLRVIINREDTLTTRKGIYVQYKDTNYMIPDSDLNEYAINVSDDNYLVNVNDFILEKDDNYGFYRVKIPIMHIGLEENYTINLMVS